MHYRYIVRHLIILCRDSKWLDHIGEGQRRPDLNERYVSIQASITIGRVVNSALNANDGATTVAVGSASSDAAAVDAEEAK